MAGAEVVAAVAEVVRCAASEELWRAVGPARAASLQKQAAELQVALANQVEVLDAMQRLLTVTVLLASSVDEGFNDEAAPCTRMDDLDWGGYFGIAVAEATAYCFATIAAVLDEEPLEDRALEFLEQVSGSIDAYFAAHLFSELCRIELQHQHQQGAEEARLGRALQAICAWTLASVGRRVGYHQFTATILWEWAGKDAFWALALVKGVLSIESTECDPTSVPIPEEITNLQSSVLTAVMDFASPCVVLSTETGNDAVPITAWNAVVATHRTDVAKAAVLCHIPELLLAAVGHAGPGHGPGLASLLVALLQPELAVPDLGPDIGSRFQDAKAASERLSLELQRLADPLWQLLAGVPAALGNFMPAQFAHDCADLAYFAPPPAAELERFLQSCEPCLADPATLLALCFMVSNAGMEPGTSGSIAPGLANLGSEARLRLGDRVENWRGPVHMARFVPWAAAIEAVAPAAPSSHESRMEQIEATARKAVIDLTAAVVAAAASRCWAQQNSNDGIGLRGMIDGAPLEFRCAIDSRLMLDPVQSPQGYTFERSSLAKALTSKGGRCPVSGEFLALDSCTRDPQLRRRIVRWVREQRGPGAEGLPKAAAAVVAARPAA